MTPAAVTGTGAANPASRTRKGQIWVIDFTVGIVVLSIIILIFMLMWNTTVVRLNVAMGQVEMQESAFLASESLLASPGSPPSWELMSNISNASAIGLVSGRNELNPAKLNQLIAQNATSYSIIKARLGLQLYQFGMNITNLGGNASYYTFGEFSNGTLNNSITFDRFAILNGTPVLVQMEVWG
jgi:hypothetical protein